MGHNLVSPSAINPYSFLALPPNSLFFWVANRFWMNNYQYEINYHQSLVLTGQSTLQLDLFECSFAIFEIKITEPTICSLTLLPQVNKLAFYVSYLRFTPNFSFNFTNHRYDSESGFLIIEFSFSIIIIFEFCSQFPSSLKIFDFLIIEHFFNSFGLCYIFIISI